MKAILAATFQGIIGNNGTLPWPRDREDMKWFQQHTKGNIVVMGRKTFESMGSKPLPDRENYVMTRNPEDQERVDGITFISSVNNIPDTSRDIYIIGGSELINVLYDSINEFYLTEIYYDWDGDTSVDLHQIRKDFPNMFYNRQYEYGEFQIRSRK